MTFRKGTVKATVGTIECGELRMVPITAPRPLVLRADVNAITVRNLFDVLRMVLRDRPRGAMVKLKVYWPNETQ